MKRIISLIAVLSMLASCITVFAETEQTDEMVELMAVGSKINIGDYVQMGTYYGEPILWRCVDIDENGPLMLSDKIICNKAFDAKGNNIKLSHGRGQKVTSSSGSTYYERQVYGSNYWRDSNIRCWLNSTEEAGEVTYLCGNSPVIDNVTYNVYDQETGFLTNFTDSELAMVKPTVQKALLDAREHTSYSSNYYRLYSTAISSIISNYNTAFSENVEDTIFLLDVKQVYNVYNNRDILGDYYITEPTEQCLMNSERVTGSSSYYWLRTPNSGANSTYTTSTFVCYISSTGTVSSTSAYNGDFGIRPAFYLNLSSSQKFNDGAGTEEQPYSITDLKITGSDTVKKGNTVKLTASVASEYASLNIVWTTSDSSVATVKNGIVTGVKEGNATITVTLSNGITASKDIIVTDSILSLTVYQNKNDSSKTEDDYILSKDAVVTAVGTDYKTDKNGAVIISETAGNVTISKSGYVTQTLTAKQLRDNPKIYLQPDSGKPVLKAVWVGDTDVYTNKYKIDITSKKSVTLKADIEWKDGTCSRIYITQGAKTVDFNGATLTTVLSDNFDVGETIYIVAVDTAGNYTKKKLKFAADGVIDSDLKFNFEIGNSISGKIPGDNPFFGGADVSLDLPTSLLPVTVSVEDSKFMVTIGVDVYKYKYDSNETNKTKRHKVLFQNIKKDWSDAKDSIKDLKSIGKNYKDALIKSKGSFGFGGDFSVIGFAEGYIDSDGKPMLTESGLILNPSVDANVGGQFAVGPVPCYWEGFFKAAVEAQMNLYLNQNINKFTPNGIIEGTITLGGGGGVGINKLASVGGGIEGSMKPHYEINSDDDNYFKLTATYGAYFKAVLAFAEYKKKWNSQEYLWLEYPESVRLSEYENPETFDMYDINNYTLVDRSYAENPSEFTANSAVLMDAENTNKTASVLKSNVYTYSQPQLGEFSDGTKLLVWVDDDSARSDINRTSLMYSYYSSGEWSEPKYVHNDGTADFAPKLRIINDTAYIVWNNAKSVLDDNADINGVFSNLEISSAMFNKETAAFENPVYITDNNYIDTTPVIFGESGNIYAAWVSTASDDVFSTDRDYSIMYSKLDNENWSVPEIYADELYAVDSIDGTVINGQVQIAYSVDMDGNLENYADKEVYLNNERLTNDDVLSSKVTFSDGFLYWYQDGNISEYNVKTKKVAQILPETDRITSDNFEIISGGSNKALVFGHSDGLFRELYAYMYDSKSSKWGNKIFLSDLNADISSYSGIISQNGDIEFAVNATAVTGSVEDDNPYGQTDLALLNISPSYNLTLADVSYDESMLAAENELGFDMSIINNGQLAVNNYVVEMIDEDGNVLSSGVSKGAILPGETHEYTLKYKLDEFFEPHDVTVNVKLPQNEDFYETDNSVDVSLYCENIAMENMTYGINEDGEAVIFGDIANRGYSEPSNVTVLLHEDSADGNIVDMKFINNKLSSDTTQPFSFAVPFEEGKVYYVTLSESGMNSDFVVLMKDTAKFGSINITNITAENKTISADFVNTSDKDISFDAICAVYSESGSLLGLEKKTVSSLESGGSVSQDFVFDCEWNSYKLFAWKSLDDMNPLAESIKY